jgi:hypothetical protein
MTPGQKLAYKREREEAMNTPEMRAYHSALRALRGDKKPKTESLAARFAKWRATK